MKWNTKKKLKNFGFKNNQFYGYLTPVEIKEILDEGWIPTNPYSKERAETDINLGISNPSWTYFYTKKFKE